MTQIIEDSDFFALLTTFDMEELIKLLKPAGIKVNQCTDGRVHFSVNLFDTSIKPYRVRYQCKGMVIDPIDNKFLSIPSIPFRYISTVKEADVKEFFDNKLYEVVAAYDGTNLTIYNFNGETYASTSKSPDVSNYFWQGEKTFSQMLFEVSTKVNSEFVTATEMKVNNNGSLAWNIPEQYCVTLGFRHHNIHPDTTDPEDVWLIRCVNRNTMLDEDLAALQSLKRNKIVTNKFDSYSQLIQHADRDITLNHNDKLYGYILQSKDISKTQALSYIFIPSSLYKLYQHFFYSIERSKNDELKHHNRYIYSLFRNVLSDNNNYLRVLGRILPKYDEEIKEINVFLDNITTKILSRFYDITVFSNSDSTLFMDEIIADLRKNESDLDIKSIEATKLIGDYIRSPENTYKLTEIYLKDR